MTAGIRYALRGAAAFGLAGLILALGLYWGLNSAERVAPRDSLFFLLPALTGILAGSILAYGTGDAMRAAFGFGLSYPVGMFLVMFTHISLQGGGRPDYTWAAIGCGAGFALAGGIGALFIRPILLLPGAFVFGLPGAAWGVLSFWATIHAPTALSLVLLALPHALGGMLLGAIYGRTVAPGN